jgi:hypothetical protein
MTPSGVATPADPLIRQVMAVTMDAEPRIIKDAGVNVINQLVWSADRRGVHTVFVDGGEAVDAYRGTAIDEEKLYADVDQAADGVLARGGLAVKCAWPVV